MIEPVARSAGHIAVILGLAWFSLVLSRRLSRGMRLLLRQRSASAEDAKRIDTLGRVFRYAIVTAISLIAGLMILSELGVQIAPLMGAAGVVGIAIGFGAQSLVKDFFSGLTLLVENQIRQGDVVEVGGKSGLVEDVTLRHVQLRDFEGNVHYIPTGSIDTVTNMSRGYAYAVIDVGIAFREDTDEALAIMRGVAERLRADPEWSPRILERAEMVGVEKLAESAVILRCRLKVVPLEQWNVRREFLRRIKKALDSAGMEIPFPQITIHSANTLPEPATTPK